MVVDAYAQLAAEGYLLLRQGARPRVSETSAAAGPPAAEEPQAPPVRYDFRPSIPDVSTFPRQAWLRSLREALSTMTDADLGYGDPRGVDVLRAALADYLGRVRGVVAEPSRVMVTCGYSQGLDLVCRTLARGGARRIAFEDPSYPEQKELARRAGLEPVAVAVDEHGIRVDELPAVDAVVLTPAHQHPTGVVLSGERRTELLAWLRDHDAIAIDDDYDAEYRYDRAAVGALQGLDPERVVYAGSASKTLAPALRIGWLVLPASLVESVAAAKRLGDHQTDRIEQHAFADFLVRGELDRHLRRMRGSYRARRDALVQALAEELPETTVSGIAAGLHATVALPESDDESAIVEEARRRRIEVGPMAENWADPRGRPPTLLLGYGQIQEAAMRPAVRALAEAVMSVRSGASPAAPTRGS
jgi:GntR family transcriptional regulator / MocR family aminotransferase